MYRAGSSGRSYSKKGGGIANAKYHHKGFPVPALPSLLYIEGEVS